MRMKSRHLPFVCAGLIITALPCVPAWAGVPGERAAPPPPLSLSAGDGQPQDASRVVEVQHSIAGEERCVAWLRGEKSVQRAESLAALPVAEGSHFGGDRAKGKLPDLQFKIQIGPFIPAHDEDLARPGESHDTEDAFMGAFSLMIPVNQLLSCGIGIEFGASDLYLGQSYPLYDGPQGFVIGTWSWLLHAELRHASLGWEKFFSPYAVLSAGWNLNHVDARVTFPLGGGPKGIPVRLDLDDSLALRAGVGIEHRFVGGLIVSLEGAWKRNDAGYRLVYSGEPDRQGTADLSWFEILGGIRLNF